MERLVEGREPGVRVDQHGVEVLVRHPARAVVVALLVASAADQDVAQAAGDEGGRPGRACGLRSGISSLANFLRPNGNSSISTTSGAVARKASWIIDRRSGTASSTVNRSSRLTSA